MKNLMKKIMVLALALVVFTSCDDDNDTIPDGQGKVKVTLTDAPFPFEFVTKANVGVAKVELKTSNGDYVVVYDGSVSYNMVELTNGVTAEVGTTNIETGTYGQARVTLNSASVNLSNGTEYNLDSEATANTYTVSIEPELVVEQDAFSEVLFDLDINESFSFYGSGAGNLFDWITSVDWIEGCNFNPHFRVCDRNQTGEISGTVNADDAENAQVYVSINGKEVYTHAKADGSFTFIGVNPGTYTVHVKTKHGGSANASDITVTAGSTTTCTVTVTSN